MAALKLYTVYSQWAEIAWNAETWHNMGMLFATLDTNNNGEIDKQDFENGRFFQKHGMFTGGQTWNKVQKHFRAFDTDIHQRISKTEFVNGVATQRWAP
jgi:Ca2+-binding EF-hand superfamily protein